MVKLRSKLHLSRQRRKSSLSRASCSSFLLLDECNATVPTRTAGSRQTEPDIRRDHSNYYSSKPASAVSNRRAITLDKLPDELLARIASFCEFGDVVRLRRSSQTLRLIFRKSSTLEQYLRRLVSMPSPHPPSRFTPLCRRNFPKKLCLHHHRWPTHVPAVRYPVSANLKIEFQCCGYLSSL